MKGSFPAAAQKEGRELPSPPHDGLQKLKSLGLASPAAPQEEGRELPSSSPGGGEGASQQPQEEGSSSPLQLKKCNQKCDHPAFPEGPVAAP